MSHRCRVGNSFSNMQGIPLLELTYDSVQSNISFISKRWVETESQRFQLTEEKKVSWWRRKSRVLSLERIQTALTCAQLNRKRWLLAQINSTQYRYTSHTWTDESLVFHFNSDPILYQLEQQIKSLEEFHPIQSLLVNDRRFHHQSFYQQLSALVLRLETDISPAQDQVSQIKTQLATYLIENFKIEPEKSKHFAHSYITSRIGVLDRPTVSNQSRNNE